MYEICFNDGFMRGEIIGLHALRRIPTTPSSFLLDSLRSRLYKVKPIDWCRLNVEDSQLIGIEDLNARTCTCMEFDSL